MKLLAIVCLFAAVAAHDFTPCPGSDQKLGFSSVIVFPDPAQVGKPVEVSIAGKTDASTTISTGAKVELAVELFGIKLASLNLDFCTQLGLACPIAPNTAFNGKITYPIPGQAPGGVTVTIQVKFTNADSSGVGCFSLQEKLVKPTLLTMTSTRKVSTAESNQFLFTNWAKQHAKSYDVAEVFQRFKIFNDNVDKIVAHNSGKHSFTMKMNAFGDLTADEFKAQSHGLLPFRSEFLKSQNAPSFPKDFKIASSVDWTSKGAVTPVKNQGQCGSCWAFSTTGAIEGAHQIATGKLVSLSEQELVDCAGSAGNQGCNGGLMDNGFEWVIKNGVCTEASYPYQGKGTTCQKCTAAAHIFAYKDVPKGDEDTLMQAVNVNPVSIAIEADQSSFQFYSGGVMDGTCGKQLDHGVLLVGYGTDNGKDYWKIKNSWGEQWGEAGYIRVIRGKDICGLADSASYPTGASLKEESL